MKLVLFRTSGDVRIGAVSDSSVVDLDRALGRAAGTIPADMTGFLSMGEAGMALAREALGRFEKGEAGDAGTPFEGADILAPTLNPPKIMMGGRNYLSHIEELQGTDASIPIPPFPRIFSKYNSSIVGPGADVIKPAISEQVDFEGELTVVIGKEARNVEEAEAFDYIAGYTIISDVTARDIQSKQELILSKNFETFCPVGPWIVTKDEVPDPHNLVTRTYINDRMVAESNTKDMLYNIRQYIAFLSKAFPLQPGDLLSTGSPPGPGMYHNPPLLPKPGDLMRITIEGIGELKNRLVEAA